ncbi:OLC1v1032648C1 [Oldenlandia corymbosa var. corymbosa]|nr:OLC1v1032648C1 [Oldenlandia corymbosa var. corymbosa]
MNSSPRKQIPIGPDYQAEIPPWNPDSISDENDLRVGRCVISPSLSEDLTQGEVKIGQGREECNCLDEGSVRCVRQHIQEAREKLKEAIGVERFADLGFYDMGEEVACKWTEEDEGIFHEVVYSNPVSLGRNFWRQLPVVFPHRTMKELVSYYFNVFILRRRAVQNRSDSLDIDSDDDEWQGNGQSFFGRVEDDDELAVESFGHQDIQAGSEDDIRYDDDGDDDDDSDNGDGDDGESGGDVDRRADGGDDTNREYMRSPFSKSYASQMQNDINSDCVPNVSNPGDTRKVNTAPEDSGTSCESQLGSCISSGHDTGKSTIRDDLTGYFTGESNDSSEGLDSGFFLDHGDARVWDESHSTGFATGIDFLPTCNMIEEIFGPFSSKRN